jgi:serine protease Do
MEMIRRSGQQGVPVVTTPDEVVLGFDQVKLARIAEKYGPPKRPPLGLLAADSASYFERHPDTAKNYPDGAKGVIVGELRPGSVAEASGLKPLDLIVSAAGKRCNNLAALDKLVETLKAGDTLSLRIYRGQDEQTITLQF